METEVLILPKSSVVVRAAACNKTSNNKEMNSKYYIPTVLFLSVICITQQVITFFDWLNASNIVKHYFLTFASS